MVEGERQEGREGGDLVPFYLRQARRLVMFTREEKKKNMTERKDIKHI